MSDAIAAPSPALSELLAKQVIQDIIIRFALAVDRVDEQLLQTIFWPEGWIDTGSFSGPVSEYLPYVVPGLTAFEATSHAISNVLIELDGDRARSQAYFTAYHKNADDGLIVFVGGRYLDDFECRDDAWRMIRRRLIMDWHHGAKSEEDFPVSASKRNHGGRKPDDPWYAPRLPPFAT